MSLLTPQEYFDKIKTLRVPEEIQALCETLTKALFNEGDKPKTRVNKLTRYNKLINVITNEELVEGENAYIQNRADGSFWKRHLHFRFTGIEKTNFNGQDGINTKLTVINRLENQKLVDVQKYLETTSKLLVSNDPHELAVGLIAASGRRSIEILVRGSFTLADNIPSYLKSGYFVNFKGQAKKRDYDVPEDERVEYRIGVLVPAEFFLTAFKRFRQMPEAKELLNYLKAETKKGTSQDEINKAINNRRGNSLRRVAIAAFDDLPVREGDEDKNTKALRAVYTKLITERDCPKNINPLLWASRAVGHFIDTTNVSDRELSHLVTTLGYSDFYIDSEVPFVSAPQKPKVEKAMQVRVLADDFEKIKQLQQDWGLPNQQTVVRNLLEAAEKIKQLEAQLLQAQAQITQLKEEKEHMITPQPDSVSTKDLQGMVKRMITEALAEALPQLASMSKAEDSTVSANQELAANSQPQPKVKPEQPERDWESVSSEELKASKHRGAAEEKIRRSYQAIANHNDHKARDNNGQPDIKKMWAVNNQTLRQLSGCNGQLVSDWMQRHYGAIDDHNSKYGLGQYHNKGKGDITEVISW